MLERGNTGCKMGEKKGVRAYMARTFNVYQWAGAESLITSGRNIRQLYNSMVTVKRSSRVETFSEAVVRLNLTAADITKKEQQYRLTSAIFGVFVIFGLIYSGLLYRKGDVITCIMALAYTFLMFGLYFRESFWYMQIKRRTLGMKLKDWAMFVVGMR
ncbi:MAG: hypothetical protein CMF43_01110 [Legionellales bacterium]|jgi:hypothetical protein|nr:hypothetical protein [Legionellales bacterium]